MSINRRKLLKSMTAGLAALFAPRLSRSASRATTDQPTPDESYDVVIVGGGVAGCYVANRLLTGKFAPGSPLAALSARNSNGKLNVGLFEYSGRVGGRLLSAEIPLPDDPDNAIGEDDAVPLRRYSEFGGFRFQPQMHIVRDLAFNHLGLKDEPFPVDEPPENFVYLRRKRYKRSNFVSADYNLNPLEREIADGKYKSEGNPDLYTYVANQAFSGYLPNSGPGVPDALPNGYDTLRTQYHTAFRNEDWAEVKRIRDLYEWTKQKVLIDGRSLIDWSWWALISNFLSDEAIAFSEDSFGYNELYTAGNVSTYLREDFYFANPADTYPDIYGLKAPPNSPTPQQACKFTAWRHITTGYSDIPNKLYQGFLKYGTGRLSHQLLGFDKADGGGYNLRFFKRQSSTFSSGLATDQAAADKKGGLLVHATYVVLAMPQRSLELLDQGNFFFGNPTVDKLLNTTILNNPSIRIFMAYKEPWWTRSPPVPGVSAEYNVPPTCGRNTTDLRVRQVYWWRTSPDNGPSFVLASYTNGQAEAYWRSLQDGKALDPLPGSVHRPERNDGAQGKGPRAGPKTMARLAHQDLKTITGVADAPEPYYCHFQNWTKDPWGAGWHAWTAGNNDNKLIPQILQPLPDEQVYICGESFSNVQGWVQGALNSSEVMLQTKLGLTYPSWLSSGGTWLGPGSDGISTL